MLKETLAQQAYLCTNNPNLTYENPPVQLKQYETTSITNQRVDPTPGLLDYSSLDHLLATQNKN